MPFMIVRNDITKMRADAIVNTANPKPVIGGGTDCAVYRAAGAEELLFERRKIGDIAPGQAFATPAFHLNARCIIHTVGPVWTDGSHGERDILRACYANSLALADELSCGSIAFPMISTGVYGFPKEDALEIALSEIGKFLLTHEMRVYLVVFDQEALALSRDLIGEIDEYIDDQTAKRIREEEFVFPTGIREDGAEEERFHALRKRRPEPARKNRPERNWRPDAEEEAPFLAESAVFGPLDDMAAGESLDELLNEKEDTFQQRLFRLIDQSGMDDVTVYKKANIDRKVFSRIRCKQDYRPKKRTAVAFAIALRLDMPTMLDLLSRAEIAFSPSSKFDLIVSFFVKRGIYDIYEINAALFKYGQPILGE